MAANIIRKKGFRYPSHPQEAPLWTTHLFWPGIEQLLKSGGMIAKGRNSFLFFNSGGIEPVFTAVLSTRRPMHTKYWHRNR